MLLRQLDETRAKVAITFEGMPLAAFAGETLAACLLRNGIAYTRLAPSGARRAPYCLMGSCFECTLVVNGRANVQSCLTKAEDGMVVTRASMP